MGSFGTSSVDFDDADKKIVGGTDNTIIGNNSDALKVYHSGGTVTQIEFVHSKIHEGVHFFIDETVQLGSGGVHNIGIVTHATTQAHFVYTLRANDDTTVQIYETATLTLGAAKTVFNSNRNSATAATLQIKPVTTVTATGTQICYARTLVADNQGGSVNHDAELILKLNTTYLFRITSNGAANNIVWEFSWYEV